MAKKNMKNMKNEKYENINERFLQRLEDICDKSIQEGMNGEQILSILQGFERGMLNRLNK